MKRLRAARCPDEVLDGLLLRGGGLWARLWQGYVQHVLLLYRQSDLGSPDDLLKLAAEIGGAPGRSGLRRRVSDGDPGRGGRSRSLSHVRRSLDRRLSRAPGDPAALVLRGWTRFELDNGSARLSLRAEDDFREALTRDGSLAWAQVGLALVREAERDLEGGVFHLSRAIELRPDWAWAYALRGLLLWFHAQSAASISDFEKAVGLDPGFHLAFLLYGRANASVAELDRAIELHPGSGVYHCWRGYAHYLMGRPSEAYEDFTCSIKLTPKFDRAHAWRGTLLLSQGRFRRAKADLRRGLRLNPAYPHTLYSMARACLRLEEPEEALACMKKAYAMDRDDGWVRGLYDLEHTIPSGYHRTEENLRALIRQFPREAWLWAWLGQSGLRIKRYCEALSALEQALRLDSADPWAWLWKSEVERRLGRCRLALQGFQAAARHPGSAPFARAAVGYCRLFLGQYEAAVEELDWALEKAPRGARGSAYAWRGEALWRCGRSARAREDFERALRFYPNWTWMKDWLVQLRQGAPGPRSRPWESSREPRGGDAESRRLLDLRLQQRPFDRPAFVRRAWLRLHQGDPEGAVEDASRALELNLDPTDQEALFVRAQAERKRGDPIAAADNLLRLRAFDGPRAVAAGARVAAP